MYSYEISHVIEKYQSNIPSSIYLDICDNSPQINRILYNPWSDCFDIWDNEGNYWNFKVFYEACIKTWLVTNNSKWLRTSII